MRSAPRIRPALVLLAGAAACRGAGLPDVSSPTYAEAVAAFYRGVAAAQTGESGLAASAFLRVTELVPREPAAWANLGLIALQRHELDEAADRLADARALAPEHAPIELLSALVERERGRSDAALHHLRRAVSLDSADLRTLYLLAQTLEQEGRAGGVAEARDIVDRMLAERPGNLVGLLERARLAAKLRDEEALRQTLERVAARATSLAIPVDAEVRAVRAAADAGEFARAGTELGFLQSALQPSPAYQRDQDAVITSPGRVDVLLTRFVRLPDPTARAAPPDTALAYAAEPLTLGAAPPIAAWVRPLWLSEEVPLALAALSGDTLWVSIDPDHAEPLAFPGGAAPGSWAAVAAVDADYDFRMDLVFAGPAGARLLRQRDDAGRFADVTARAFPGGLARGPYAGAWAADLDMEGDMDLVLARVEGEPVVLLNRGDGGFERSSGFAGVTGLRDFLWADLDADGDPDAALLDAAGRVHVFRNQRTGPPGFLPDSLPDAVGPVLAIAAADLDRNATLDLLLLAADGALARLSRSERGWELDTLARGPALTDVAAGAARLLVADLDNNGESDVVGSTPAGTSVWLGADGGLRALASLDLLTTGLADLDGDGRLDLLGVAPGGRAHLLRAEGAQDYYSATLRPRAAEATGDRRINAFGIGGEIELRAGLLYQKRIIDAPVVRFGLGEHPQADVARIIWPNGTVQAEFNVSGTSPTILTRQRLKGSCPWVFTYDGRGMRFVTDFIWRTALGLRINAQGDATVIHSEDWIRIGGDQLAPRDGFYDVRVTAELWETHYFDHVALRVVDHPEGTELFVDERFRIPPPEPAIHVTGPRRPVAEARDQTGRDVTALIRARDQRYLDTFPLGPYQGLAADHYVEVALGDEAPVEAPLWLVAYGWVYPTDASINVAISQGEDPSPRGLALEAPDGRGGWRTVRDDLGFPSGKTKTMLIPLDGVFRPGTERRLRLRTNMEVYWDEIAWAAGRPDAAIETRRLLPEVAELRYRGFSRTSQAGRRAPDLPRYEVATGAQVWRDLVGFYTRYGDVRPLNQAVDDRYVIMNAGDELALRFPAPPPPAPGWTRDFVLVGDGWIKDGDYNSGFSMTVAPLPYHGLADYGRPPGPLRDDPAYRLHPEDWAHFHTRYVTPRAFHRALVPDAVR